MKILITNSYYYPAFVGGAEISVKLLAEGLVNKGNDVYVLTTGYKDKVYRVNGVLVISIKQKNIFNSYGSEKRGFLAKTLWHLIDSANVLYYFKVASILKRIKPEIAHTNSIQGFSPLLWLTIKLKQIPLVHSTRDYYMLCHKCNMYNEGNCASLCAPCNVTHQIKKRFFKYPDHFIGISSFILAKYRAYHPAIKNKSSLIYNAVEINNTPAAQVKAAKKVVFGYIGRLEKDKGVEYLANELAALPESLKPEVKLVFAGKGDDEFVQELKHKLKGFEADFLGLSKPDTFYKQIDVLLVPALWNEPFGRIVIESLAYSVPVCQSDRGGLKELYNADNSWLFSPVENALTTIVTHILTHQYEIEEKRKNCLKGIAKFSADRYINEHISLYKKLLTKETTVPESKEKALPMAHFSNTL